MIAFDLLIVGGGPAGLRAAIEASAAGLSVVLADEAPEPGGQIWRGAESGPFAGKTMLGPDYARGAALAAAFRGSGAQAMFGATVFQLEQEDGGFTAGIATGRTTAALVRARAVVIASGAQERPFPIPGWTLPGAMTAGAAQTLLKANGVVPEGPVVMAGTGPLLYLLAAQYASLGVKVTALLDTTPPGNLRAALPHLPAFLASAYAWKGFGLMRRVLASTRVHRDVSALSAEGEDRLARVRFRQGGVERVLGANVLLLHQGVAPQVNLAMAAGVRHAWNDARCAFEPLRDAFGQTAIPGLFVAGDTGGIAGAEAAEAEGALAAIGVARLLAPGKAADEGTWRARLASARRGRAFLDALFRPRRAHLVPADDVIVCRCEEVTAGGIRDAVRGGARGPNQVKAFTRAGMGPCQARMCGLTTVAIIAAEAGASPDEVGYPRLRMPVKPVTVAQMAALGEDA